MTYVNFDADPDIFGVDWALRKLGWKTGHSGNGWSFNSAFMQCPRKFKLLAERRAAEAELEEPNKFPAGKALEIGIIGHAMLELYYGARIKGYKAPGGLDPESLRNKLLDHNTTAEYVGTAWRVFEAYVDQDPFMDDTVVDVELHIDHRTGFTARLDLLIEREGKAWLVDHKIIAQFTATALECWQHNGTVLGQQLCYRDDDSIPELEDQLPLGGTIINLLGKQKEPKFHQHVLPYRAEYVNEFSATMQRGFANQQLAKLSGVYHKDQSACVAHFGRCFGYDECWK